MNEKKARSLFMDYLYDELDAEQRIELETFLENHPDLLEEFNELRETRSMIQNIPIEDPVHQYVVVQPVQENRNSWLSGLKRTLAPQSFFFRSVVGIVFLLISMFLIASVTQFNFETSEAGWSVNFGSQPEIVQYGYDKEEISEILSVLHQENMIMATALIEEAQIQNEIQLRQAVTAILEYMEEQRNNDLLLVGRGLAEIEQENYYRYILTNETLSELLQTIQQ